MNIIVFFTFDVSLKIWSEKGLLERELKLYENFADRGHTILLLTYGSMEDLSYYTYPNITILPIYSRVPYSKYFIVRLLYSIFIPFLFKHEIKASNILKTNQTWGAHVAIISKLIYGKPCLARSGFNFYEFYKMKSSNLILRFFVFAYSYLVFNLADRVHVSTKRERLFVKSLVLNSIKNISVVPNWIDHNLFKPLESTPSHRLLYVGRLSEQKNLHFLFKALAKTNFSLDIIGSGELYEELVLLSKRLSLDVQFLGTFPNNKLSSFISSYRYFILPSKYEGNPKTLLEAMSSGLIVLGNNVDGINNIINDSINGFLFNSTQDSLVECLYKVLLHTPANVLDTVAVEARQYILKNHTFDALSNYEIAAFYSIQQC